MENKFVSVIVTVYNVEPYLEKCIASICSQKYQNLEIILIDDGSKDASGAICDFWKEKDSRIAVIHQKNSGVSAARNKGIEKASGEYLVFIDSDDYLEPDYVSCLMEQQNCSYMTVCGYYREIEMSDRRKKTPVFLNHKEIHLMKRENIVNLYSAGLLNAIWNKLYVVRNLKEVGIRFEEAMSLGEDLLFNLRYLRAADLDILVINKPLYHYMKRGKESLDNRYRPDFFDNQVKIFQEFIRYTKAEGVSEDELLKLYGFYFNALVVSLDNLYHSKDVLGKVSYRSKQHELRNREEFGQIIKQLKGKRRLIYGIRLWGIRSGFYYIDYCMREILKKYTGMK